MRLFTRRPPSPAVPTAAGERVLAWAAAAPPGADTGADTGTGAGDGVVAGTRAALHLPGGRRLPWEQVEAADWDEESATLHVVEVGTLDDPRPEHRFVLADAALLLELVRERVTASVVLQRHVAVSGRAGVFVIARRAPTGARDLSWVYRYDAGVDPDDPEVRRRAAEALASARAELGDL